MSTPPLTPTVATSARTSDAPAASPSTRTGTTGLWKGRSPAGAADAVWVPLISGVLTIAAGAMSLATGTPWLFAGLGPTAIMIAASPGHPTTRFHAIVVGYLAAFICAWLALLLLGAGGSPTILSGRSLPVVRVWASGLAIALTALVMPSLRAYHPPAGAMALLVTLGVYRITWKISASLLAGVLLVALLGEWFQRIRLAERASSSVATG